LFGALDVDRTDPADANYLTAWQRNVLMQQVGIIAVGVPGRFPRLVVAQPESYGCVFCPKASSGTSWTFRLLFLSGERLAAFFTAPLTPLCDSAWQPQGDALLHA